MRFTTKIVLGIFLSIFLLSLGAIIGFSFTDRVNYNWTSKGKLSISQENIISVDLKPYKTIRVEKDLYPGDKYNIHLQGTLYINPITASDEKNKLFLSEELFQFSDIVSSNDTLIIRLQIKDLHEKYVANKPRKVSHLYVIEGFNFYVHTNTVDIISNLNGVSIDVRNIKTDKININTYGNAYIDSCQTGVIEPHVRGWHKSFRLKNSQVKELNIDLDLMAGNWTVENCDIEVENLTGSGKYDVQLPKSEAKIMNWIPKDKDAKLNVTLYGDTARIVFP